ncbi:hypothetical protein FE374_17435 [Georgenia yuyongxinii]|uniref:Uncharacterized protein n=1 Tax=Georgenia yuyongxinii TaxID=2589797 RepID=A0A5B8C9N6_9MICO|nr:hypothetical protein [Georgenia yuyongxinii]QDC26155.1 hypothetical protein FE374_17435 [Georgenia yuyongxinii]
MDPQTVWRQRSTAAPLRGVEDEYVGVCDAHDALFGRATRGGATRRAVDVHDVRPHPERRASNRTP